MTDGFPRLANAILGIIRSAAQQPAPDATTIREGIIASVREDGRATIRGYPDVLAPKSPTFKMAVGQRVHVAFRGPRPVLILGHNWKRAHTGRVAVGFGIEELLLVEVSTGVWDVVFRNDQQAIRLNLQTTIGAEVIEGDTIAGPFRVGWGQTAVDNLFYVLAARKVGSPPAGQGSYLPRVYLFRLSRGVGEPAGGSTVTASLVRTIDPTTWTMPAKYSTQVYHLSGVTSTLVSDVAHVWPYSARCREFVPIIESADVVTLVGLVEPIISWDNLFFFNQDIYDYLVAVRTDASAVLWEAPTTDEYRQSRGDPFDTDADSVGDHRMQQQLFLGSLSVSEWTADRKRIAAGWTYTRITGAVGAPGGEVINDYRDGIFLETGALATRQTILAWHVKTSLGLQVADRLRPWVYAPAAPGFVLYHVSTVSTVSPDPVGELQLLAYDVTGNVSRIAASLAGVNPLGASLFYRGAAVQYLADDKLYAIAENSATAGASWPAAVEREKFIASPTQPVLTVGVALVEDGALAGKGALADLPAGITAPDPLFAVGIAPGAMRIAYHVVGTP